MLLPRVEHSSSLHIFEAAQRLSDAEVQVALMGHGPGGDWTRIHAPLLNQAMVYTTLDRDYSSSSVDRSTSMICESPGAF